MQNYPEYYNKPYNPNEHEEEMLVVWDKSDMANPDSDCYKNTNQSKTDYFSIVFPPANVTGSLHMGHSARITVQDTIVRFHRMLGKKTLFIPGTDHAAIATESKVVKALEKEGIRRSDLTNEQLLEKIESFALESKSVIISQLKRLGASLDWSREAYTKDAMRTRAVNEAFTRMYHDGLLYRGDRIVNWDPKGQTVISDDEIVRQDEVTKFYYFKYGPFVIGTARPETKFADKYIIVHPDDARYSQYEHMQTFEVPWINGMITATLIKDEIADPEMGTGAMTITPWHSEVDFELAEKYKLPKEQIIDKYGKLLPVAGEFAGMKIAQARPLIVEKMESLGLVDHIDDKYQHALATAERTGGIIEPQIMRQWFIDTTKEFDYSFDSLSGIAKGQKVSLKYLMNHVVTDGQISIIPDRFEKVYMHWVTNLRPWCISRQIIFGHKMPIWYKDELHSDTFVLSINKPTEEGVWIQETDTLDTWFSSALWTFSTLGWPEQTTDFKQYHPTSLLETGQDILPFWVSRMILMSTYLVGQVPFKDVLIAGILRDEKGNKISKSLGNNIDPVEVSEEFGTDSMRMAIMVGTTPGMDLKVGKDKFNAYKKFSNKLWNLARFVLSRTELDVNMAVTDIEETHKHYLDEFEQASQEITGHYESYRLHLASEGLYHYIWHTFADTVIEELKKDLESEDKKLSQSATYVIHYIFYSSLKLLHPCMPFITEKIWSDLPTNLLKDNAILSISSWPTKQSSQS